MPPLLCNVASIIFETITANLIAHSRYQFAQPARDCKRCIMFLSSSSSSRSCSWCRFIVMSGGTVGQPRTQSDKTDGNYSGESTTTLSSHYAQRSQPLQPTRPFYHPTNTTRYFRLCPKCSGLFGYLLYRNRRDVHVDNDRRVKTNCR